MAEIIRKKDNFIIRSKLTPEQIKFYTDFDSWCYLHRIKIRPAMFEANTQISFDVGMLDENLAYLLRAICEIEKDERGED